MSDAALVPIERIERAILTIRGERAMLDADLAQPYEVPTRILVRNVKRKLERFPAEFLLQLTSEEWCALRSHSGISNEPARGGHRYQAYAFTEQGSRCSRECVAATGRTQVNIETMRVLVRLRQLLRQPRAVPPSQRSREVKVQVQVQAVFHAIRKLTPPGASPTPATSGAGQAASDSRAGRGNRAAP